MALKRLGRRWLWFILSGNFGLTVPIGPFRVWISLQLIMGPLVFAAVVQVARCAPVGPIADRLRLARRLGVGVVALLFVGAVTGGTQSPAGFLAPLLSIGALDAWCRGFDTWMTDLGYPEVAAHWRRASVWARRAFAPMAQVVLVVAILDLSYGTTTARWTTATVATPALGFVLLVVAIPFVVLWLVALVRSASAHRKTAQVAQGFAGPHGKELAAIEEAVASCRRLATTDAGYEPALGGALNDLSVRLAQVGRRGDALAASEEAVAMFRRLTAPDAAYLPGLAMSLNNLSADFCGVGRRRPGAVVGQHGGAPG